MEDFFDEMSEFEVKKWKLKHVMDHLSQAPGWGSMYAWGYYETDATLAGLAIQAVQYLGR